MNTDITASAKPEYPVVDRNPPFTKTVAISTPSTTSASPPSPAYFSFSIDPTTIPGFLQRFRDLNLGIKPNIRGPSMVTGGLIGLMGGFMYAYQNSAGRLMGGFMYAYQNSAGRLMGFFPNDVEVARYK